MGLPSSFEDLWENEVLADVIFFVGDANSGIWRFAGHKLVLSQRSPVFMEMFDDPSYMTPSDSTPFDMTDLEYATKPNGSKDVTEISVTDISPDTFEDLLKYIYTDVIQMDTVDSAVLLHQAAQKYKVKTLIKRTVEYISTKIIETNVIDIYSSLEDYMEQDDLLQLQVSCAEIIDQKADRVFNSNAVHNLKPDTLYDLTSRSTLRLSSEGVLLKALLRWSIAECKRRHMELNNENKRLVLGKILFNVRWFAYGEAKERITEEMTFLKVEDNIKFNKNRRLMHDISVSRFSGKTEERKVKFPLEHQLSFISEQNFILTSVVLRSYIENREPLFFSLKKGNRVLFEMSMEYPTFIDSKNIQIQFPHPVNIEPYVDYVLYVHMFGNVVYKAEVTKSVSSWNDGQKDCFLRWKNSILPSNNMNGSAVKYGQLFQLNVILPLKNVEFDWVTKANENKWLYTEMFLLKLSRLQNAIW